VIGPASTNFDDYLGTVAADDAEAVLYEPSLYELADLDRDRFTIIGSRPQSGGTHHGDGLRYRRSREHPAAPPSEIAARGRSQGNSGCAVDLPEASAEELIRQAFSRIAVRLVTQPLRDHALLVTEPNSIQDIEA
jgi:hypothetical protein